MSSHRIRTALHRLTLCASVAGVTLAPAMAFAQKPYSVLTQWKIGGEGGWDYLTSDPKAHRLYVTHGAALDDAGKVGYVSDGGANVVVVFDRTTLASVASIPAGTNPDGIVFEPVTKTVWAFNGRSNNATVIDTDQRKVVATIALSGKPEFPVADGRGTIFANIETKNEIVRLDAET